VPVLGSTLWLPSRSTSALPAPHSQHSTPSGASPHNSRRVSKPTGCAFRQHHPSPLRRILRIQRQIHSPSLQQSHPAPPPNPHAPRQPHRHHLTPTHSLGPQINAPAGWLAPPVRRNSASPHRAGPLSLPASSSACRSNNSASVPFATSRSVWFHSSTTCRRSSAVSKSMRSTNGYHRATIASSMVRKYPRYRSTVVRSNNEVAYSILPQMSPSRACR